MKDTLISKSWKSLFPKINIDGSDEQLEEYCLRNKKKLKHIPHEVIEQWFFPLHDNDLSLMNYAWINYETENVEFVKEQWTNDQIASINILSDGKEYYDDLSTCDTWDKLFHIIPNRKLQINYWLENGTWEVPPVILDCNSFPIIPEGVEINGKYQLVEGYTRTGILNSLIKIKKNEGLNSPNDTHKVWLIRNKSLPK